MFGPQETLSWLCRSSNATSCCLPRNRESPRTSVRNPSSRSSCPHLLLRSRGNEPPHPFQTKHPGRTLIFMKLYELRRLLTPSALVSNGRESGLFYFHCMRNLCVKNENKFYLLNHMWLGLCLPGRMWKRTERCVCVCVFKTFGL